MFRWREKKCDTNVHQKCNAVSPIEFPFKSKGIILLFKGFRAPSLTHLNFYTANWTFARIDRLRIIFCCCLIFSFCTNTVCCLSNCRYRLLKIQLNEKKQTHILKRRWIQNACINCCMKKANKSKQHNILVHEMDCIVHCSTLFDSHIVCWSNSVFLSFYVHFASSVCLSWWIRDLFIEYS